MKLEEIRFFQGLKVVAGFFKFLLYPSFNNKLSPNYTLIFVRNCINDNFKARSRT